MLWRLSLEVEGNSRFGGSRFGGLRFGGWKVWWLEVEMNGMQKIESGFYLITERPYSSEYGVEIKADNHSVGG